MNQQSVFCKILWNFLKTNEAYKNIVTNNIEIKKFIWNFANQEHKKQMNDYIDFLRILEEKFAQNIHFKENYYVFLPKFWKFHNTIMLPKIIPLINQLNIEDAFTLNVKKWHNLSLEEYCNSFYLGQKPLWSFITCAFDWSNTKEGFIFWEIINNFVIKQINTIQFNIN